MDIGRQIKTLRLRKGLTQKLLAKSIGVSEVSFGNWERGVSLPSIDYLIKIAMTLNVSLDELVGHKTVSHLKSYDESRIEELTRKYLQLDKYGKKAVDSVCNIEYERVTSKRSQKTIPLYTFAAAAGCAAPFSTEEHDLITLDDLIPSGTDFAIRISGDSMEPIIKNDELVYVKRTQILEPGDIGVFSVDGGIYCKQYQKDLDGTLHLFSLNPEREDFSIHLTSDSSFTVKCYGKVLLNRCNK